MNNSRTTVEDEKEVEEKEEERIKRQGNRNGGLNKPENVFTRTPRRSWAHHEFD